MAILKSLYFCHVNKMKAKVGFFNIYQKDGNYNNLWILVSICIFWLFIAVLDCEQFKTAQGTDIYTQPTILQGLS